MGIDGYGWVWMGDEVKKRFDATLSSGISYCHLPSLVISTPQIGYTVAFCRRFHWSKLKFHWSKLWNGGSLKTFD